MKITLEPMFSAFTGIWEMFFLVMAMICCMAIAMGILRALVYFLNRLNKPKKSESPPSPSPSAAPATQIIPPKCPQCGTPLPSGVLAGLCPACLLKMGAADDTVTDAKQKSFVPPDIAELAAKFPQLEILELIGRGGMGAVYKARQKQLDRIVALKILPPGIGNEPAFAERFTREARALAKLNHPNIVTLYEFGDASGQFYFLMEFVDGVNLRQLLHAGRISAREALAIVPQICDALQFAHDQGIVHRDIKPENILMDRRGRVKVADFGLAKIIENRDALTPSLSHPMGEGGAAATGEGKFALTDAGKTMGTPNYMSPEQITAPGEVDHRADIYALGVVFYQMLTGELPGKKLEAPSTKVQIDVRLDEIVLRALEKNPALRYQQVSEVKTCVETIAATPESSRRRGDGSQTEKLNADESKSQSLLTSSLTNQGARFSRTAIVGACWAAFSIFAALFLIQLCSPFLGVPPAPIAALVKLFILVLLIPSFTAPIATTLLGWLAVSQIRRSAGKLHGMWLAVFDGLFFPLLALDGLIFAAVGLGLWGAGLGWKRTFPPTVPLSYLLFVAVLLGILLLVDWLIIRRVWRAVNRPGAAPAPPIQKPDRFWRWFMVTTLAMIVVIFSIAVLGLLAAIAIPNFVKARSYAQTQHQNQTQMQLRDDESLAKVRADKTHSTITDTNEIAVIQFTDAPLTLVIENLARNLHLNYLIEPKLEAELATAPTVSIRWEKLTARRALTAILDSRDLQLIENSQTGVARITRKTTSELSQLVNPNTAAAQNLSFGPVMERTLFAGRDQDSQLLCLDDGSLVVMPPEIGNHGGADVVSNWWRGTKADLAIAVIGKKVMLSSLEIGGAKFAELPSDSWEPASPADVTEALQKGSLHHPIVSGFDEVVLPESIVLPVTFAVESRTGKTGLLQITGFTDNPHGVKIRYKLVQSGEVQTVPANDEAARLKLQTADQELAAIKQKVAVGVAPPVDLDRAIIVHDITVTELKGDTMEVTRLKLQLAEFNLKVTGQLQAVGKASQQEYDAAKLARDMELARYKLVQPPVMAAAAVPANFEPTTAAVMPSQTEPTRFGVSILFLAGLFFVVVAGVVVVFVLVLKKSKSSTGKAVAIGCGVLVLGAFLVLALLLLLFFGFRHVRVESSSAGMIAAKAQAESQMAAAKARAEQLQAQSMAAMQKLSFGPVIERTLEARQSGTNMFLDLDTGKILAPPPAIVEALSAGNSTRAIESSWQALDIMPNTRPAQYLAWLKESGADVMFNGKEDVLAFDGVLALAHGTNSAVWDSWDGLTPDMARFAVDQIEKATRNINSGVTTVGNIGSPSYTSAEQLYSRYGGPRVNLLTSKQSKMWFFKTREGGMGILRIAGFTENPRGVKIRYKLVQSVSTGGQAEQPMKLTRHFPDVGVPPISK